jgi:hypothetical protein
MTEPKRNERGLLAVLLVAPVVGVVCAFGALFLNTIIDGAALIFVLASLVVIPAALARWMAARYAPRSAGWGVAVGAVAIALVEAFVLLLILLSRANFN